MPLGSKRYENAHNMAKRGWIHLRVRMVFLDRESVDGEKFGKKEKGAKS